MSMDVTQLKGYSYDTYQDLRAACEKSGGIKGGMRAIDARLISLVNAGMSFADAVAQVKLEIPALTSPIAMSTMPLSELQTANASSFANVMAAVTNSTSNNQQNVSMLQELGQSVSIAIQNAQNTWNEVQRSTTQTRTRILA